MHNNMLYLSVTQSRRLAVEMPVGNPFDGHFYGKKQMPVVAVVAGIASAAAGAAAIAAGAAGLAAVAAGAMVVGGALTVIGTISGNQKLAKIGGILSLAGGIGTMATNAAGAAGTAADTIAGATAEANAINAADSAFAATNTLDIGTAAEAASSATAGTEALSGMDLASDAVSAAKAGGDMAVGKGFDSMGLLAEETAGDTIKSALADAGDMNLGSTADAPLQTAAKSATTTSNTEVGKSVNGTTLDSKNVLNTGTNTSNDPSMMAKLQAWVKENPKLAEMAMAGGSSLLKNMVPSEQDKLMMERYRQQTELAKKKELWATGRV